MQTFDTVGAHVLADFWGCQASKLDDAELLMNSLRQAARTAKMTILGDEAHQFEPQGFTGLLLLSESHISIHTYTEKGYVAIDVSTYGSAMTQKASDCLKMILKPTRTKETVLRRGVLEEAT